MKVDATLEQIVAQLRSMDGCHTIIVCGSRARGDHTACSDYDLIGAREGVSNCATRDCGTEPISISGYIQKARSSHLDLGMLTAHGGRVLAQKCELGDQFLERLDALYAPAHFRSRRTRGACGSPGPRK